MRLPKPVALYFVLAVGITWLFWVPPMLVQLDLVAAVLPSWLYLLGGLGPIGAATIVAWIEARAVGVRDVYQRIFRWRVGAGWYILVLVLPLAIHYAIVALDLLAFGVAPGDVSVDLGPSLIPAILVTSAFMLVEEVGWRGYALPRLQVDHSALTSAAMVGVVWGIWHIPLLFARPEQFGLALDAPAVVAVLVYVANTTALSVVFAWLFNSTRGSLLLATLFHGALNTVPATYVVDADLPSLYYWVPMTLILVAAGAAIVLRHGAATLSARPAAIPTWEDARRERATG